jgi:hypothetical protein
MAANVQVGSLPAKGVWAGRIVSWLPGLFLLLDGVAKLVKPVPVIEGTVKLGYSESVIIPLGIVLIVCTVLYLIPRTAVLGAILLTGYLGGAVATHVRAADGIFPVVFAVTFGVLLWLGVYLRDARLREFVPLRS